MTTVTKAPVKKKEIKKDVTKEVTKETKAKREPVKKNKVKKETEIKIEVMEKEIKKEKTKVKKENVNSSIREVIKTIGFRKGSVIQAAHIKSLVSVSDLEIKDINHSVQTCLGRLKDTGKIKKKNEAPDGLYVVQINTKFW